ncbi:hypothetical protein V8E36_000011 [Tilletia maclaganii]
MVAPLPLDLPKECAKATKILNSFVDPIDGLDKLIPIKVLERAKGFAIFSVIRVGFILSARAGSGIVIARTDATDENKAGGHWTAPTAIGIAGLGGGFNAGAQIIDCLVVLNSAAAVRAFSTTGSLQLGGNLSVAVGPVGRSAEASGSLNAKGGVAAMFSYSRAKGLYGGVSLEGTVLVERTEANEDAYGRGVTAAAILGGRIEPPTWSHGLIDSIEKLTKTGHLADRLDRARQEEIDREYGSNLVFSGKSRAGALASSGQQHRTSGTIGRDDVGSRSSIDSSPGLAAPPPRTRRERESSGSLWGESDDNDRDTLSSLSRSSGRALTNVSSTAFPRHNSAATGTLFDDDFGSDTASTTASRQPFPAQQAPQQQQSSSKIKIRATPPPPIHMGDYVFGGSAGGSITNTPSAGRRTPGGRPPSSGGRRTPGGSMSLFSRSSNRTPAATTEDPYASYFDSNQGGTLDGATPGSAAGSANKRPGFLRHRTRSSASKRSFSLVPAAFRRDTPPVPGGSQLLAEEELERKLRLYDEGNGSPRGGGNGMQRSYSASGAAGSTPAYAGFGRSRTSPAPASALATHYPTDNGSSSRFGFSSSEDEDGFGSGRHPRESSNLHDTYEESLAREMALARRPSPPHSAATSSAWARGSSRRTDDDDENDDDFRRLEVIARRQRAILDAEERGSLDEFDRELQQERARLSSSAYARYGSGSGTPHGHSNGHGNGSLARTLLSRSGSVSGGGGVNGGSGSSAGGLSRSGSLAANPSTAAQSKFATGRSDPFAELYASQTGSSPAAAASTATGSGGSGAMLGRRLSSVRSSGDTSLFDSSVASSQAQSQLTPASSVGGLPQLDEYGSGTSAGGGGGGGGGGGAVVAMFTFKAQMPSDLGFAKGDVIRVTKRTGSRDDWWEGANAAGQVGSFPANYTQDL